MSKFAVFPLSSSPLLLETQSAPLQDSASTEDSKSSINQTLISVLLPRLGAHGARKEEGTQSLHRLIFKNIEYNFLLKVESMSLIFPSFASPVAVTFYPCDGEPGYAHPLQPLQRRV